MASRLCMSQRQTTSWPSRHCWLKLDVTLMLQIATDTPHFWTLFNTVLLADWRCWFKLVVTLIYRPTMGPHRSTCRLFWAFGDHWAVNWSSREPWSSSREWVHVPHDNNVLWSCCHGNALFYINLKPLAHEDMSYKYIKPWSTTTVTVHKLETLF